MHGRRQCVPLFSSVILAKFQSTRWVSSWTRGPHDPPVVVVWQLTDVISGDKRHGIETSVPKCRLLLKTYWSRMRRWISRDFQILIVSAVKICKQCLQTASAPIEASPLDPTGELLSSRPSGLKLPNENSWRRHWPQNTSNAARLTGDARHGLGG